MAVNLTEKRADELLEIDGIRLFTGRAGIKQQDRDDLTLMVLGGGHTVGRGVYAKPFLRRAGAYRQVASDLTKTA